jgi:hypothetical protein
MRARIKDEEIEEMLKSYDTAVKEADPRYMSPDEKNTPRKKLYETLCNIQDEKEQSLQKVKQLIAEIKESSGDFNYYYKSGSTPISIACDKNKPAILKLLLEEKADYHFTHSVVLPFLSSFAPALILYEQQKHVRLNVCKYYLMRARHLMKQISHFIEHLYT